MADKPSVAPGATKAQKAQKEQTDSHQGRKGSEGWKRFYRRKPRQGRRTPFPPFAPVGKFRAGAIHRGGVVSAFRQAQGREATRLRRGSPAAGSAKGDQGIGATRWRGRAGHPESRHYALWSSLIIPPGQADVSCDRASMMPTTPLEWLIAIIAAIVGLLYAFDGWTSTGAAKSFKDSPRLKNLKYALGGF